MKTHLIMPMGGRGSRFFNNGIIMPKPLIEIHGKPFFYWSTKSLSKDLDLLDITFVVLQEHIDEYHIDEQIHQYFPAAQIVVIPEVLNGAVLTCLAGIDWIHDDHPMIFNDCDHMFRSTRFAQLLNGCDTCDFDGALLTFESDEPKYSYAMLDEQENVIGTVEKKVVSNQAICGAYFFRNASIFKEMASYYLDHCDYSEYYVSGVYNEMINHGLTVKTFLTDFHLPFGTPDEYEDAKQSDLFEVIQ